MVSFLTSFATGGVRKGLERLDEAAVRTGEILDELRPDVQTKFTALQNNADKYSKILKIATKYDKGTSAFNYFFDRGELDTSKSAEENAKYILNNMNSIPDNYGSGENISGLERIQQNYEGGINSINEYINLVGTKNKLGPNTKNLLLTNTNPAFKTTEQQLNMPVKEQSYVPGVLGGNVADAKNNLMLNTAKMNAYITSNLNRQPTMDDYTNPDIADAAGAIPLTQRDIPLFRDAIGEKDYFKDAINEGVAQYVANSIPMYNVEGENQADTLNRIVNNVNSIYDFVDSKQDSSVTPMSSTSYTNNEGLSWESIKIGQQFIQGGVTYRKIGIDPSDSSIEIVG